MRNAGGTYLAFDSAGISSRVSLEPSAPRRIPVLPASAQDLLRRERCLLEPMGQRFAFQVLHDEIVDTVLVADVVESADVRMTEARNGPGLALEALARLRIAGKMFGKNF